MDTIFEAKVNKRSRKSKRKAAEKKKTGKKYLATIPGKALLILSRLNPSPTPPPVVLLPGFLF